MAVRRRVDEGLPRGSRAPPLADRDAVKGAPTALHRPPPRVSRASEKRRADSLPPHRRALGVASGGPGHKSTDRILAECELDVGGAPMQASGERPLVLDHARKTADRVT